MASTMEINVKNIRTGKVSKICSLEIKVLKKVSPDHYVVGDKTDKILLVSDQSLKEDSCYKLIKPSYEDKKLKRNKKFAAVKLQKDIKTEVLKAEEAHSFEAERNTDTRKVSPKITNDFDYSRLHDDIWYSVFIYLDLKSIYTAEVTDSFFQNILKRTKFWSRKIRRDFPHCDVVLPDVSEEESYFVARRLYFDIYRLNHVCNICKLCFINISEDLPHCEWRDYID